MQNKACIKISSACDLRFLMTGARDGCLDEAAQHREGRSPGLMFSTQPDGGQVAGYPGFSVREFDYDSVIGQRRHEIPSSGQKALDLLHAYYSLVCTVVRHRAEKPLAHHLLERLIV